MDFEDTPENSEPITYHALTIDTQAYYSILEPSNAHGDPPDLVLVFHGYGQSGDRFLKRFEPWRNRNLLVVAPFGPHQTYMNWEPRTVGFVWMTLFERERAIEGLMAYIHQLLSHLREHHKFNWRRVFVLGFSQGATVAWRFATRGEMPVDGLICCGSDLPPDAADRLPAKHRFPVRLVHARDDSTMVFGLAEQSLAKLTELGYEVSTDFFEGGHRIPPAQVKGIGDWIEGLPG
ncbi:MAG: esterase [Candidatus Hydrogenedentota bacterium]